ncbi:MAG: glutamyl-tRNA reductase [Proteobacteria bacterium]|nr:glutamyl-tRNA reductase [Pseudomonadota bacterium]
MKILLMGMNHRSAPLAVREHFAVDDPIPVLQKLVRHDEVNEAVLVSTCNRVEVAVVTSQVEAVRHRLHQLFAQELGGHGPVPDGASLDECLYEHRDGSAVRHIFRVASSIDSMVVGEPQILGQIKDAHRAAVEAGSSGPVLGRLYQRAFSAAKRVKNETRIAERPVSVARVAVDLAAQIFEDLDDKHALLVGAGEMMEAAAEALCGRGLAGVRVANRTRPRAEALAARFGATPHGLDEIDELLPDADVVLTCIGGDGAWLDPPRLETALARRWSRPLFVIDIGVPRNVDPRANELENVYLYDIDDLSEVASANARERADEAHRAEEIVQEEWQRFDGWLVALQSVPTIRDLRARAETLRAGELERYLRRLNLDVEQHDVVDQLTKTLMNKLLHAPLARLRAETDREEGLVMLEAARALFGLDEEPEDDDLA